MQRAIAPQKRILLQESPPSTRSAALPAGSFFRAEYVLEHAIDIRRKACSNIPNPQCRTHRRERESELTGRATGFVAYATFRQAIFDQSEHFSPTARSRMS